MPPRDRPEGQAAPPRHGLTPGSLAGLDRDRLAALIADLGEPGYRAGQLFRWVQHHGADSYEEMTNLPARMRGQLAERHPVRGSRVAEEHASGDGTRKLLLALADGETVECVLIPEGERRTACISTQVGCGVGCVFCASGVDGMVRNLTAGEIVEQVFWLRGVAGGRLSNIVVMGMGEPLHNVDALVAALRLFSDPEGIDMGARRITVSTSGPTAGFEAFLRSGLRTKLAVSLHAATDPLRRELVPRGGTGAVAELAAMADRWFRATGRDVTFEYVLMDGVNDRDEDAAALARLCGPHRNVNLIPLNPVSFAPGLKAPPSERIVRFERILEQAGAVVNRRRQRGDDVAAACGQLRRARG